MSRLFTPLTLRSVTIPNRVWTSPMCMYSAPSEGPDQAAPTDWHLAHLATRAVGGSGLVVTEATAVLPEGRISPWDLGLWNDTQQEAFRRISDLIRRCGAVPGIQLSHAGRKASSDRPWNGGGPIAPQEGGWDIVGPSTVPFPGRAEPHALSTAQMADIVQAFRRAARRAVDAGFEVLEIHGAHGYLLSQFCSPLANTRTDDYGGSFENRVRFPLEVVDAVREEVGDDVPLLYRVSATDWTEENPDDERTGWTRDDTVALATLLLEHGIDLLDVSSGGNVPDAKIPAEPGYQVPYSAAVKKATDLPTAAVGIIVAARQAEDILVHGQADAVFMARELLRDPYAPNRWRGELDDDLSGWPRQYERALRRRR